MDGVEAMLGAMRTCFAADRPVRTSSLYEVMSIRGLERPRKSPHRAWSRIGKMAAGFEDGVASVRRTERALIRTIVRYEPLVVCRTRSGVAGVCRTRSSASAVVDVPAVLRAGVTERS